MAACALAGGVAVPATALADPPAVPPGQAKKQQQAPAPAGRAAPTATAAAVPPGLAKKPQQQPPGQARGGSGHIPPGQAKKVAPAAPARARPSRPAPAATTTPSARRAGITRQPSTQTTTRRPAPRRAAPRRAAAKPAPAPQRRSAPAPVRPVTAPAAVTPAATRAAPTPRRAATRPAREKPRTITRTITQQVTEVVEVIPRPLRLALAGLLGLAAVLLAGFMVAARRARGLERQRRRLTADVGLLQSALLPDLERFVGSAAVSAAYRPAEGLAAGGDFYDAFALDAHRTCVIVGDVAGHGRDAIPVTASVRYTVRAYLEGGLGPRHALQVAGRVLDDQLRERLVTIVVAIYDDRTGLLTYASAGHPPPVVLGDEVTPVLAFSSPALGLGAATGRRQVTVPLLPGSAACLYTDGLADVLKDGERLGLDRLADAVRALGPGEGAPALLARLGRRADAQPDDMAAVVIRPPADAPATRVGRIEELEVDAADLRRGRLARFLEEYGVSDGVAEAALRSAHETIARTGAALVAVAHDEGGATVAVEDTPHVVALPLQRDPVPLVADPAADPLVGAPR
jgi:hypothetical protein